jgi:hypothetical protein
MKKVLLLGNGINRIDNNYSWNNLMDDLLGFAGMKEAISLDKKPFPMLYEEIYLRWSAELQHPERFIKKEIAGLMRNIRSNDLHRVAMKLKVDEILTTNYDYNLESVTSGGIMGAKLVPPVKGSKYALMRKRKAGSKTIWHIHGESHAPGTILLGYEQYAGYLQTIRNYIIHGAKYTDLYMEPLTKRLIDGNNAIMTWVDHFFVSDLYILGLNMDFVEIHLWWLLDFRARLKKADRYQISNQITYIYPSSETEWIKPRIDLLCACGVKCIALPIVNNDWKGMYKLALEMVNRA